MLGLEERLHQYEPLFGGWYLCGEIGSGSYGRVYRVEYRDAFGTVFSSALKAIEILPDGAMVDNPQRLQELVKEDYLGEVGLLSALRGVSNIVSMEDQAIMEIRENGRLVGYDLLIRMELLDSIGGLLRRGDAALHDMDEVRRLGTDICRALVRCHRANILHRDINPNNIFRNRYGDYKLGDFGIAKRMTGTLRARTAIGTKLYVAPEVMRGAEYGARADVYSLGLVLYQLTNRGYLPFFRANLPQSEWEHATMRRLGGEDLPVPSQAEPAFSQIILRACAFEPEQRFASAQEMYDELLALDRHEEVPLKQQTTLQFWQERPEKLDLLGAFGLCAVPSPEMRYMARQLIGYPQQQKKQQPSGVLTPRTAVHLPAWRIRAPWFPFNRLTVRGYSSVGDRAFRGRRDLISVRCGKQMRTIGCDAFAQCGNIGEVTCESGLEDVMDGAFCDCTRLLRCHLPDSVHVLGEGAFAGCSALASLRVPDGVQALGDRLFDKCTALRQVTLPTALRSVGQNTFRDSGIQKILLPDSCLRLGEGAFMRCRQLTSVQTSFRMAVIPKDCFFGCVSLTQIVFPLRLAEIRDRAFCGCTSLTQVVIPEGTRRIGAQVFAQCEALTSIRVPDSVQHIGDGAFGPGGFLRGHFGKLTVIARSGSYAWQYCKENGIRVKEP